MIAENVENIRVRVARACRKAGRKTEEVTLMAVTKMFPADAVREVIEAGVYDLGENFVQEVRRKRSELCNDAVRWHFIGHLQTNKVKYIAEWVHLIHSVDSVGLGKEISTRSERAGRTLEILLEVNTTGEKSKFGITPKAVPGIVKDLARLPFMKVAGLMTIGPFKPDPEESRPAFQELFSVRDRVRREGFEFPHLSMGMSNDFEIAVEEGATIVRVGTAIFGKRSKTH
jgi:hypothetical protein